MNRNIKVIKLLNVILYTLSLLKYLSRLRSKLLRNYYKSNVVILNSILY